jgi:hypothetical protein
MGQGCSRLSTKGDNMKNKTPEEQKFEAWAGMVILLSMIIMVLLSI